MTPEEEYSEELERRKKAICPLHTHYCECDSCAWWKGDDCTICKIADTLTRNANKN